MPVFGACPYDGCHGLMRWVEVPPHAPMWMKDRCEDCGKIVWRWLTRINPQAWPEEAFLAQYEVDEAAKAIKVRPGCTDTVQEEYSREAPAYATMLGIKWPGGDT